MVKSPDIAGFFSAVLAILAALPTLYWAFFEREVHLNVSERIYFSFYLSDEGGQPKYFSIIAPLTYYSLTAPDRTSTIIHEKVDATFSTPEGPRSYTWRWQHLIEPSAESFIDLFDPAIDRMEDAEAFVFNGQAVSNHLTMFVPRTEHCAEPGCDSKRNYLLRGKAQDLLKTTDHIQLTFTAIAFPRKPITQACEITLGARDRRSLQAKIGRGERVVEFPARCIAS